VTWAEKSLPDRLGEDRSGRRAKDRRRRLPHGGEDPALVIPDAGSSITYFVCNLYTDVTVCTVGVWSRMPRRSRAASGANRITAFLMRDYLQSAFPKSCLIY
jgi:hypothetical protein